MPVHRIDDRRRHTLAPCVSLGLSGWHATRLLRTSVDAARVTWDREGFESETTHHGIVDAGRENEAQLSLALSLVIGAVVGLVVVAFIVLTGRLAARMYPPGGAAWRRVLVPTLGSLVTGFLLFRYFPFARGSGIPQAKYALFVEDGRITMRTVVGKFLCCCTALASGVSLGREGPSVQVGAGIASVISRRLGVSRTLVKSQLVAGSAAALAAAFNTPIAAVLFALEEIMGDLHAPVLGSVVVASATAWMVLHLFLGDQPLFHVPGYQLVHPVEFALYAVLGWWADSRRWRS